ncbi:unnamed protein product [Strongylus vulgaris]|uniref:DUF4440 domain-containing protein n=1 Tax=Strongylus vulgaris TaxID=40348 RepID=A0A3P7IXC0_STRVU|nr:unnamed protein product [Strongylus vulgaris]
MSDDYIILSGHYETKMEKGDVVKGDFNQIWKKTNGKYLILHDYIMYCGESELKTEKLGLIKGKFSQIWRKTDGKFLLLREAWESDDVPV